MTSKLQGAEADLAFMRALAEGGGPTAGLAAFGTVYFAAGLLYGLQVLVQWADGARLIHVPPPLMLVFIIGVSVVFFAVMGWIMWRGRRAGPAGVAARAVGGAFGAVGTAYLTIVVAFAWVALRERNLSVWLLYPVVVFAMQGAAWLVAFSLRQRLWLLFVAVGWLANAVALGFCVEFLQFYVPLAAFGLFAWMMIPGAVLMRQGRRAAG
ncbi:MAG: hypothetical protein ACHP84_08705 [Caulobacterales bacterium]